MKKGTKLYGIYHFKCPRCHEGDLFDTPTFSFQQPFDMPKACLKCGQSYMPEPGFYYGAMFISYILTGFFSLAFVGLLIWGFGLGVNAAFLWLILVLAVFFVFIFRFARVIWINLMVKYRAK